MDLSGITAVRPGADDRNPDAPNAANYDEAYSALPDPLRLSGGHTSGPNWPTFLAFAERHIKAPPLAAVSADSRPMVALTFDDLPAHGPLPAGVSRVDIVRNLIVALQAAKVPPIYAFVNAKALAQGTEMAQVLKLWRDAGFLLGNHTCSHMDLDANSVEAFEEDIRADEATLREFMGAQDWHWFRYPYLREGTTNEKRDAVRAFLRQNGYKVAEVTLSFSDWAYSEPYTRCLAKGDQAAIDWMTQYYLARASESAALAQKASQQVYGRDIPLVLLLHAGGFQALTLPTLLDLLKQRGFAFVTLEEAENDAAYAAERDSARGSIASRLQEMNDAAQPAATADSLAKLDALCR